jgi:hypothetical protein
MQPTTPPPAPSTGEPNVELLRRSGWSVGAYNGPYCVAWRGHDEAVFEWRQDGWHRVAGRGGVDEM